MELCQVLPKLWKYVKFGPKIWNYGKFCQKYGIVSSFAKFMELCEVLGFRVTCVSPPKLGFFFLVSRRPTPHFQGF